MALPVPSSSAGNQSGLTKPFLVIDGLLINLQTVAKIDKLESPAATWQVMFYETVGGSTTADGYASSQASEAACDAVIANITQLLEGQGAIKDIADY